ncbi:unnamed protein product [Soboliphyme baturini]|uniref:SHSP domain-containing protein n=1 Tax=Soboliphyme baturini TaxID=241478 RepID=A0A183IZC4_9BILA|nr:unnamed protein product [Soboliphyme baturini]
MRNQEEIVEPSMPHASSTIEEISPFKYLGAMISRDVNCEQKDYVGVAHHQEPNERLYSKGNNSHHQDPLLLRYCDTGFVQVSGNGCTHKITGISIGQHVVALVVPAEEDRVARPHKKRLSLGTI